MKITKTQLKQIIKEELESVLPPRRPANAPGAGIPPEHERELHKMFDAGKRAAAEDGNDIRTAIRLAGEYALESKDSVRIKKAFPNAYAWLLGADQYAADEELEHWMAKKKYSMR